MYKTFMQHAKKVIKNAMTVKADKPILQGVKHFEDGSLAVTDAHRLYVAKDIHDMKEIVITPSGDEIVGNYPDIKRLIPDIYSEPIRLEVKEIRKAVEAVSVVAKRKDNVMKWEGETLKAEVPGEVEVSYTLPWTSDITFSSNAQYWIDALMMFKAFKYSEIDLRISSALRPFTLTSPDDKLMVLILPVRSY